MTTMFGLEPNLKIGTIFEVSGTCIKVALRPNRDELTRLYNGRVYTIGEIGSLIRMRFGRRILFASVRSLRLQTEEEAAAVAAAIDAERRVLEADLIGEGAWDHEKSSFIFQRGLSTSALPMQDAYIVSDDELALVYDAIEQQRDDAATLVTIGEVASSARIPARANIDLMFGHHCAILGSTGSGKSSAVAAVLRSVLDVPADSGGRKMRPRIILIDPHGEYGRAFEDEATVFRAYDVLGHAVGAVDELKLPYWLLSSDEFRSLVVGKTEFEATSQANVVYKALAHARMVGAGIVQPARDWIGEDASVTDPHPEDPRPVGGHIDLEGFDRDRPTKFDMREFRAHIEKEQCVRFQRNKWERVTDSDWEKNFVSILNKLKVLERDPRIKFLMRCGGDETLPDIMAQFFGKSEDDRDLKIVDISGLPNEVAGPLTAAIARTIFNYKLFQTDEERREDPLLLICEEAHRYVPDRGEAQYASAQFAIRRVAREGRKYGLGLMLVSQRPSDLEGTVLSQCGTWLVLRLSNASDQAHVARFLPDSLATMVSMLPSLPRREALFVGEGAAIPSRIRIRYLDEGQRPRSDDIAFGAGWRHPFPEPDRIAAVCDRMISQVATDPGDAA